MINALKRKTKTRVNITISKCNTTMKAATKVINSHDMNKSTVTTINRNDSMTTVALREECFARFHQ
jgi:hypothetical protein